MIISTLGAIKVDSQNHQFKKTLLYIYAQQTQKGLTIVLTDYDGH